MRKIVLILICLLGHQSVSAQVANFQSDFNRINKNLMTGLGSFAVSNFVLSGVGYASAEQEEWRRFHEMNIMWNTVNFGLAVPGYLKARKGGPDVTLNGVKKQQRITETVFLVNGGLDLVYVSTGAWMRSVAPNKGNREALYTGYGNSLILQGSFLLVFDAMAYWIHHQHGKEIPMLENVTLQPTAQGISLVVQLD